MYVSKKDAMVVLDLILVAKECKRNNMRNNGTTECRHLSAASGIGGRTGVRGDGMGSQNNPTICGKIELWICGVNDWMVLLLLDQAL